MAIKKLKKIYVWPGMEMIHSDALKELQKNKIIDSSVSVQSLDQTLCGECELKGGYLTFENNDGMDSYFGDVIDVLANNERFEKNQDYFIPLPYEDVLSFINAADKILNDYSFVSNFIDEYDTKSSPALLKKYYQTYKYKKKSI